MLFKKITSRISFSFNVIASVSLMGIVFLTTTDIVCRYFFNHPVTGTYDLVGLMGAVVASFSMPYTLLEKGHVSVEILMQRLSRTKQLIIDTVMHFVSILLFLALTWQCLLLAQDMAAAGEVTPTLLLPFYPIVYCMAICFCVLCFAIFVNLLNVWSKGVKK